MKVILRENGIRPSLMTPARTGAPQGGRVLVDLLAEEDFADLCTITLDWQGDGFTPAMVIHAIKWVPEFAPQNLQIEWIIDLEDAFGQGNMTNAILRQIVDELKTSVYESLNSRRHA